MKWTNLLIAVFMTLVACMPCSDTYGYPEPAAKASVASATAENHQESGDVCTPLCICSCCAGFSQPAPAPLHMEAKPVFRRTPLLSIYRERHLTVHASIWQPPKL